MLRTSRSRPEQRGQVLPMAVVLLLLLLATFLFMINAGQTLTEKIRVTHAADAAAYSAAVVEARALNMDAYLNRAMLANEIAIAQLVSVSSWANYLATGMDNYHAAAAQVNLMLLPDQLLPVAALDVVFGGGEIMTRRGKLTAQKVVDLFQPAVGAAITVQDLAVQALASAQGLMHAELALGLRQQAMARQVVTAMDKDLQADVVLPTHTFGELTRSYARRGLRGDERGRFADVVQRSRDPFSRQRNWTLRASDIPWLRSDPALKKRGGTELVGYDEWRSVDTLELHGRLFGCGFLGFGRCSDIEQPVAWGAALVSADDTDQGPGYHGNAYAENRRTAARADAAMQSPMGAVFHGLPDTRDLAQLDPDSPAVGEISLLVSKPHAATMTSAHAVQTRQTGRLAQFGDVVAGGRLVALSRAQVYFDRIALRADGFTERASLYNPYWRVRLVEPTTADRLYAATLQGGLALP